MVESVMKFIVFEAPQLSNKQAEIIFFWNRENNSENFNQYKSFEKIVADIMSNYNITNFFVFDYNFEGSYFHKSFKLC